MKPLRLQCDLTTPVAPTPRTDRDDITPAEIAAYFDLSPAVVAAPNAADGPGTRRRLRAGHDRAPGGRRVEPVRRRGRAGHRRARDGAEPIGNPGARTALGPQDGKSPGADRGQEGHPSRARVLASQKGVTTPCQYPSAPSHSLPLAMSVPVPGGVCLQRVPHFGPDPAALHQLVERVVQEVASTAVLDLEVYDEPAPIEYYTGHFREAFWARIPDLAAPKYLAVLLAAAERRGVTCLTQLVTQVLPHLKTTERHLAHNQPFAWEIPDGKGGVLTIPGVIDRMGEDRESGTIRAYEWRLEDFQSLDWMAPLRTQRIGVVLGWSQARYPGKETVYVEAYLASDVLQPSTRSAQDLRHLQLLLQLQAAHANEKDADGLPFGALPVIRGMN